MGEKHIGIHRHPSEHLLPQDSQTCPTIKNQIVLSYPHFNAGSIATIANRIFARTGNAASDSPEMYCEPILCISHEIVLPGFTKVFRYTIFQRSSRYSASVGVITKDGEAPQAEKYSATSSLVGMSSPYIRTQFICCEMLAWRTFHNK